MSNPEIPNEEELRQRIRERLQERERIRDEHRGFQQQRREKASREEDYRRIVQEEESRFYADRPDLIEYVNELGETEFVTRDELRAREGYFNYEEKVENTEQEKRKVFMKLILLLLLLGVGAVQLFIYIQDDFGEIAVFSNVKGAHILLDGERLGEVTDAVITEVTPGRHLLQLEKPGYRMHDVVVLEIDVKKNRRSPVSVEMVPASLQ